MTAAASKVEQSQTASEHNWNNCQLLAGIFQSVVNQINHEVLELKQLVSMATVHSVYSLNIEDTRQRSKLKTRIRNELGDKLKYLWDHARTTEMVCDAN